MTLARARSFLLPGTLVAFAVVGCGPDSGGSPELVAFEAEANAAIEAYDADSKSDNPSTTPLLVGDITPGEIVSHDVSPATRLVAWGFRAEAGAAVNARAALQPIQPPPAPPAVTPSPGAPANMLLYRKVACLGRWERVSGGTGVLEAQLPGAGEYMLVSGATDPNRSGSLRAGFSADNLGNIVTDLDPTRRHPKLRKSWLPANTVEVIRAAGVKSYKEIAQRRGDLERAGLSKAALDELVSLAPWLDVPQISHPAACALRRVGAADPKGYYRLSYRAQQSLEPLVPWASIPVPPEAGQDCVRLVPPGPYRDPRVLYAATSPHIDWNWRDTNNNIDHVIQSRPWWAVQGNLCQSKPDDPQEKRWYPDPKDGWQALSYRFGRSPGGILGGPIGYIIFANRHTGILRLFVYLPTNTGYDQLMAHVSLVRPSQRFDPVASWNLPLEETLPEVDRWVQPTDAFGTPAGDPVLQQGPQKASFVWRHDDADPTSNLHQGGCRRSGRWLRTEINTLYDERLYRQALDANGNPTDDTAVALNIEFSSASMSLIDFKETLKLELNGSAVPTANRSPLQVFFDTTTHGIAGAGSGSAVVETFWAFQGMYPIVTVAALLGAGNGFFGPSDPPSYAINLVGVASGRGTGRSISMNYLPAISVWLTGTFTPVMGRTCPAGETCDSFPEEFQACDSVRIGAVGFLSKDWNVGFNDGVSRDPRPPASSTWRVPVSFYGGRFGTPSGVPYLDQKRVTLGLDPDLAPGGRTNFCRYQNQAGAKFFDAGTMFTAPWSDTEILEKKVYLETRILQPTLPHKVEQAEIDFSSWTGPKMRPVTISINDWFEILRANNGSIDNRGQSHKAKVLLRWWARIRRKGGGPVSEITQAFDVTDRLREGYGGYNHCE